MAKTKAASKIRQDADGFPLDPSNPLYDCHLELVNYLEEARQLPEPDRHQFNVDPKTLDTGAKILGFEAEGQLRYLTAVIERLLRAIRYISEDNTGMEEENFLGIRLINVTEEAGRAMEMNQRRVRALFLLGLALLRRKLPHREETVCKLLELAARAVQGEDTHGFPLASVVGIAERYVEAAGTTQAISDAATAVITEFTRPHPDFGIVYELAEDRNLRHRLEKLTLGQPITLIEPGEAWSDRALADFGKMTTEEREHWLSLFTHARTATQSQPTKKFIKEAARLLEPIGLASFKRHLAAWIPETNKPRTETIEVEPARLNYFPDPNLLLRVDHIDLWKGLVWCSGAYDDEELTGLLGQLTDHMYRKIPRHGARSSKVGNACVSVFAMKADAGCVAQLERLRSKVKKRSLRGQIDRAIDRAAGRQGTTKEDLAETSIPTYGLQSPGVLDRQFGDVTARLSVVGPAATSLQFVRSDGKVQQSAPAAVRRESAAELKELKKAAKDIQQVLRTERDHFERTYMEPRSWSFPEWKQRFVDHPLMATLAGRLIWRFVRGKKASLGVPRGEKIVGTANRAIRWMDDKTRVDLWHPLGEDLDRVAKWRDWLVKEEVTQPFKQAYREIYPLTDAERETRVYSNRMAGHIIRQHQFQALCEARGWQFAMIGDWSPADKDCVIPTLRLPRHGLRVEYWIEYGGGGTSERGVAMLLSTDQVRFHKLDAEEPIPLEEVPDMVFSEVMRDVDLFVGVASVGNDPTWQDQADRRDQYREYWRDYAFGELAETARTRREALERLIPRLAIADRCSMVDRFLTVRGDLRTYKIHLGSGNILMEPNDEYLCIVADQSMKRKSKEDVFLPFEGDDMLSLILSKAFLLADDKKIDDRVIVSQINRAEGTA